MQANELNGSQLREWVRGIVLWRRDLDRRQRVPEDTVAEQLNVDRHWTESRGGQYPARQFLGGGEGIYSWTAYYSGWRPSPIGDTLFVLDSAFFLPTRDSTVIVLVDHVNGESLSPRIVHAVTVVGALPPAIVTKVRYGPDGSLWSEADNDSDLLMFKRLRSYPVIAAYLARAP